MTMDGQTAGLVGGLIGGVLGIAGGAVGTAAGIRAANGPRERALVVRLAAVLWVLMGVALAAMWLAPLAGRFLVWLPLMTAVPLAIPRANARLERLRREDERARQDRAAGGGIR